MTSFFSEGNQQEVCRQMCNTLLLNTTNLQLWIMELSFPRTFAPGSESSIGGTFAPWNFRSMELLFPGTFVPWNFRFRERKWRGTFAPQHKLSVIYTHFKKAFDKVPHNRLISKLGSYGIDQALVNSPYAYQNLFSRLHMGSNITQIQTLFFPTILGLELRKKLKAHTSRTKSQQLRPRKFQFYTALQITFLFSLLTRCIYSHHVFTAR